MAKASKPEKEQEKDETQEINHGLDVHPSMPYYCTWLPGACPEGGTDQTIYQST